MALTAVTVFLSAFLLFLVQPIIAKLILPRFNGNVTVWATCLVFFQAALLLGYAFAHHVARRDGRRAVKFVHVALLLNNLTLLPIVPVTPWPGAQAWSPSLQILGLLLLTIGLPFTLLAMTSPLLQAWCGRCRHGNPTGCLRCRTWRRWPRAGVSLADRAVAAHRHAGQGVVVTMPAMVLLCARPARPSNGAGPRAIASNEPRRLAAPLAGSLAALGSYALVAITNHLTQNIPSFPMMWVLPLVIYLLSFTLCFDAERWYPPRAFRGATLLALAVLLVQERQIKNIAWHIGIFLAGLFVVCMVCHGELARSRPVASRLTHFYLAVSAGGVFGGAVVALGAPALLRGYFRSRSAWCCLRRPCCGAWGTARLGGPARWYWCALPRRRCTGRALDDVHEISRNFYGVLRARECGRDQRAGRVLIHGRVLHGQQFAPQRAPADQLLHRSLGHRPPATALDDRQSRSVRWAWGGHHRHLRQAGRPLPLL
jgi:hypothetical protein